MIFGCLDPRRFEALAGYSRQPEITLISNELAWYACKDERVLGMVLHDLIDDDYSWVVFGRDELQRYRAINVNVSIATVDEATDKLFGAMASAVEAADVSFHQGDAEGEPVDFFAPVIAAERLHPIFKVLATEERYSPARAIIQAMMHYHKDIDGNFIQNFQAGGFDARLWELYLWATFTELGYVRKDEAQIPDFVLRGNQGSLAIEAASANPPEKGIVPKPTNDVEFIDYIENYIPIKLATALKKKLNRKPAYWARQNSPVCLFASQSRTSPLVGLCDLSFPQRLSMYSAFGIRWKKAFAKSQTYRSIGMENKRPNPGSFNCPIPRM